MSSTTSVAALVASERQLGAGSWSILAVGVLWYWKKDL